MGTFDGVAALSFDCYGTLIDWEQGIAAALGVWAERYRLEASPDDLVTLFGQIETNVQTRSPAMLYPQVLAECLREIGGRLDTKVDADDARRFGASVGDWLAFADSPAALSRLATRFQLIILSNVDRASFLRSQQRLGVAFDTIITAEDVGAYKPASPHFEALLAHLDLQGVARTAVLHVAQSIYHDHEPAKRFGIESVWIDRRFGREGWGATPAPQEDSALPQRRYTSMSQFAAAALPAEA